MKYMLCAILAFAKVTATEYAYPLFFMPDSPDGVERCLVLYQHDYNHTELWLWNSKTLAPHKLLLSMYNPAGIRLLPDASGFSFIDNDRIRIKYFQKRSVKTLEFALPFYDITLLQWIAPHAFIFSAKEHGLYHIYYATKEGWSLRIQSGKGSVLYPQKVGDQLFFIERIAEQAVFSCSDFPQELLTYSNDESLTYLPSPIYDLYLFDHPVAFLSMHDNDHGFVIGHPHEVNPTADLITFDYYALTREHDAWQARKLFHFTIPTPLLLSQSQMRFYESMLPLIPQHAGDAIYYLSAHGESLHLYSYVISTQSSHQLTAQPGIYCSPRFAHNKLYYGGLITPEQEPRVQLSGNTFTLCLPHI